jgi:hypothetical protein
MDEDRSPNSKNVTVKSTIAVTLPTSIAVNQHCRDWIILV